MNTLRVGICGLGTIGGGSFRLLRDNLNEITRRTGREIKVEQVADIVDELPFDLGNVPLTNDAFEVAANPRIDVVVELIGGTGVAKELMLEAIRNGKHIVTANKALIAQHGDEIFAAAREHGVVVAFEAAIGGGIPIVKAVREGLAANRIECIAGIINGTSNYILTEMEDERRGFAEVLREAQELGYAEADPTFDIDGVDAAHKLTILCSMAFGLPLHFDQVYMEGISQVTLKDIEFASELGYCVKHLGITRRTPDGVELRVHPTLISKRELLANVRGVMNAVLVLSDAAGATMYYGAGAGATPTASAVVADIIDIARLLETPVEHRTPFLSFQPEEILPDRVVPIGEIVAASYLRMEALDRPGVLASVSSILGRRDISIEALIQKEAPLPGDTTAVPIVILTNRVREEVVDEAIAEIEALEDITGEVTRIRVESLHGTRK